MKKPMGDINEQWDKKVWTDLISLDAAWELLELRSCKYIFIQNHPSSADLVEN